jgi:hypothetical protein
MEQLEEFGFIILRHVNNNSTNKYWIHCYDCIRNFYPENHVIIIDDNSNYDYITPKQLYKTTVINSEYPGRGELLPYYYFLKNNFFNIAVVIHDSVFITKHIEFNMNEYKYKLLWEFEHDWDQIADETNMINVFDDFELKQFYENKHLWKGCFGGMSIIKHDYLTYINNKYDISKLLDCVLNRYNRCSFERVFACLLQKNEPNNTLLGNIQKYCPWGINFEQKEEFKHLPMIKVWTGR